MSYMGPTSRPTAYRRAGSLTSVPFRGRTTPTTSPHSLICAHFGKLKPSSSAANPNSLPFQGPSRSFVPEACFVPINSPHVISQCLDKRLTASVLEGLGYAVPRTMPVASPAALAAVDYFPVVVKPAVGAGGSRDVFLAQDAHELNALADYLGIDAGGTFFVQEYVGTPEHEYTVGVLVDMDGTYMNSIAMKRDLTIISLRLSARNRTSRLDLGERLVVSSGISQEDDRTLLRSNQACKDIAQAIRHARRGQHSMPSRCPRCARFRDQSTVLGYDSPSRNGWL